MGKCISVGLWVAFFVLFLSVCIPNGSALYRDWLDPIFSFHVKQSHVVLEVGESRKIGVAAVNQRVTFRSKDFKIVSVDRSGKIVGKRAGTTVIYVKGKKTLLCKVTVVALNKDRVTIKKGGHAALSVKGTWSRSHFKSTNKEIAVVNYRGRITAKKKGRCKIICKVKGKTLSCAVDVR